jgi:hypothetical protein
MLCVFYVSFLLSSSAQKFKNEAVYDASNVWEFDINHRLRLNKLKILSSQIQMNDDFIRTASAVWNYYGLCAQQIFSPGRTCLQL